MAIQYKSILVAVDGSKEAEYAFHKAIDIAKRNEGSKLTIANVFNPSSYERTTDDRAQKASEELVSRYKSEAEAAGIENVKSVIEYGSPKTLITRKIATSIEADSESYVVQQG